MFQKRKTPLPHAKQSIGLHFPRTKIPENSETNSIHCYGKHEKLLDNRTAPTSIKSWKQET